MADVSDAAAPADADDDDVDDEAAAAAEALMQSVQRAFAAAKKKGVPAAMRLMKELRAVCAGDSGVEIKLLDDNLMQWEVSMYDWALDEASALHKDLKTLAEAADDLVPLRLRISFPDDFPFAPPLVFCASPVLASEYVFDGALCMEMLVDWQPTYGNVEALLVQICAFLAQSGARVQSLAAKAGSSSAAGAPAAAEDDETQREKAERAYANLKAFHAKKGWSSAHAAA